MGNKIKEVRKTLKLSQQALANKSGISRATISSLENNKGVILKTSTMEKIASALGKTVSEIFFS